MEPSIFRNRKLLFHIAVFAITGGFIAIVFKWCYASGWAASPMALMFYRSLVIGLCYLAVALYRRNALLPRGRGLRYLLVASQLKTLSNAIIFWLLVWVDASFLCIMAACLLPVFLLAMTRFANPVHDKLSRARVIACLLAGVAAALMGVKELTSLDNIGNSTFLYVSLMCFLSAAHLVVDRKAIEHGATHMQSLLAVTLYTVPGFLVLAMVCGEPITAPLTTPAGAWTFVVCVAVGLAHFGSRRECMGQSQVSGFMLITYLPQMITVIAAILLLGEKLDWPATIGLVILPLALWIGRARKQLMNGLPDPA